MRNEINVQFMKSSKSKFVHPLFISHRKRIRTQIHLPFVGWHRVNKQKYTHASAPTSKRNIAKEG